MAKLSKDEIQKIFLSGLLFLALVYCYFQFLLTPADKKKAVLESRIAELETKTREGKGIVRKLQDLQQHADEADETLLKVESLIPEGAAVAWFPPKVNAFFEQHGISDVAVTQTAVERFDGEVLQRFRKMKWAVEIPKAKFLNFAIAVAGFENSFPLVRISGLDVQTIEGDPVHQAMTLNLESIFKP